jgi:hypothetical protein
MAFHSLGPSRLLISIISRPPPELVADLNHQEDARVGALERKYLQETGKGADAIVCRQLA